MDQQPLSFSSLRKGTPPAVPHTAGVCHPAPGARPCSWIALALCLTAVAASCGEESAEPDGALPDVFRPDVSPPVVVDLRADVNRNGVVDLLDPTEDADEDRWDAKHGAVFLANIDDDDSSCPPVSSSISDANLAACHDAANEVIDGQSDLSDLARLKTVPWPTAPNDAAGSITLSLVGAPGTDARTHVRLFRNDGGTFKVCGKSDTMKAAALRKGVELAIEGRDIVRQSSLWGGYVDVTLTVQYTTGGQARSKSDKVRLRLAPLLTSHHLQPLGTLFVSKSADADSVKFRSDLGKTLGSAPGAKYVEIETYDQWTQDFFETAWMSMPGAGGKHHVVEVFIRSANVDNPKNIAAPLREAGRFVFKVRGRDVAVVQQYDLKHPLDMDTLNSLGNLETVPPYSHGGQTYTMGRMIMGNVSSFYPDRSFTQMLESQAVQKPIWVDTSWLLVGHTDETISFLKASSQRGWVLALNDPAMARKMLQDASAAGNGAVKMFVGKYWLDDSGKEYSAETTIDQVLADTEVMSESAKAQVEIASQLSLLKKETGITDAEIIHVPFLHYPLDGYSVAYQPGTVNSTVIAGGHFVAPDPHGPVIGGVDIFKQQMQQAFAKYNITVHFIDDWNLYHRLLGEVHCGTNAQRSLPTNARWWEAGR